MKIIDCSVAWGDDDDQRTKGVVLIDDAAYDSSSMNAAKAALMWVDLDFTFTVTDAATVRVSLVNPDEGEIQFEII